MLRTACAALLTAAALFLAAGCGPGRNPDRFDPATPPAEARISLYYSASLVGNLDGCTCEHAPAAGLVKRAAFLRSAEPPAEVPRIDGGDLLPVYPDPDLAGPILDSYRELGYAAVAVGELDLQMGARELARRAGGLPLLGHNLRLRRGLLGWKRLSTEPLLLRVGGARLAVFALLEPALLEQTHPDHRHSFRLDPEVPAAAEALRRARAGKADLVLLLYHGTRAGLERLLSACPGVDLALLAHEEKLVDAERIGDTIVLSPGELGNRLGRFDLALQGGRPAGAENGFRLFSFRSDPDDPVLRERADRYRELLRARLGAKMP